jgi:hypothetical protein
MLLAQSDVDGSTASYGLVQVRYCSKDGSTCTTKSISCADGDDVCQRTIDGGKQVIGVGIVSLVAGVVGIVFCYLSYKKGEAKWRRFAIATFIIAGGLAILAVLLYSKKTVILDYSFILYLFASFISVVATTVILVGPGIGKTEAEEPGYKPMKA